MTTEHDEDDFDPTMDFWDLIGKWFVDAQGRKFSVLAINHMFDLINVRYHTEEGGEDASIRFADWLAATYTEIPAEEFEEEEEVYAGGDYEAPAPVTRTVQDNEDDGWGDEDYVDDEEARFEQVKEMARAAGRQKFDHVYSTTKDYDYAQREAGLMVTEIITLYETQRLARGG